ncbi:biotin synthase BioB [Roseiconus nitratireducens]|uniref:Biotin synthase n=1 Tax=Roseiconus nitratireducens TaxID=2605748 RepID=A0A5M6D5B9_9BACT|nr:biotin synthase BioB [Roseiconus nitratireducens]KAA5542543.1 biotin synthase BioB [Roseiconus nitratireducens]
MATDLTAPQPAAPRPTETLPFDDWADRILRGGELTREEARQILASSDRDLLALLAAGFRLREKYFGKTVQLYFLMNAKSGLCPEDCHYCSQSKISTAPVPKYNILKRDALLDAARLASERGAKTYCLVISARGPNEREMNAVEQIVPEIKSKYDLDICACLGLLSREQADRLKACGVDRVNHNLNTGEDYYGQICSTHSYADRVQTLRHVRDAGMEMCSGGIIGMGESHDDIVSMAFDLKELGVQSIPLNFLNSIDGTPLQGKQDLSPQDCLRALAMFRFVNPSRELRISGGREIHLRSLQPLGLYVANSVFVGDYLTTKGQAPEEDYQMIRDLGFDVTTSVGE